MNSGPDEKGEMEVGKKGRTDTCVKMAECH